MTVADTPQVEDLNSQPLMPLGSPTNLLGGPRVLRGHLPRTPGPHIETATTWCAGTTHCAAAAQQRFELTQPGGPNFNRHKILVGIQRQGLQQKYRTHFTNEASLNHETRLVSISAFTWRPLGGSHPPVVVTAVECHTRRSTFRQGGAGQRADLVPSEGTVPCAESASQPRNPCRSLKQLQPCSVTSRLLPASQTAPSEDLSTACSSNREALTLDAEAHSLFGNTVSATLPLNANSSIIRGVLCWFNQLGCITAGALLLPADLVCCTACAQHVRHSMRCRPMMDCLPSFTSAWCGCCHSAYLEVSRGNHQRDTTNFCCCKHATATTLHPPCTQSCCSLPAAQCWLARHAPQSISVIMRRPHSMSPGLAGCLPAPHSDQAWWGCAHQHPPATTEAWTPQGSVNHSTHAACFRALLQAKCRRLGLG